MMKRFGLLLIIMVALLLPGNSLAIAEQAKFTHKVLTLTLPDGWSVKKDAVTGKELIGWLESKTIPGASILVYSYRGVTINYRNVRIRGLKRIAADYPKGQNHLKKPKSIKTQKGYKPKVELWQGFLDAGGTTVALQSPMAVMKKRVLY